MYKLTDLYKQIKEEESNNQSTQYKIFCDIWAYLRASRTTIPKKLTKPQKTFQIPHHIKQPLSNYPL
jgi:hypothetical protein